MTMRGGLDVHRVARGLARVVKMLESGEGVKLVKLGPKRILRIEWLNLYVDPEVLYSLAGCIALDVLDQGLGFDAVVSIETSGAKYGVATALLLNKPYFSLHKVEKVTFENPVHADSYSVTERTTTRLYVDKPIASRFKRVLLVDDIKRSSRTVNAATWLLRRAGSNVVACYIVLDLAFAGGPPPSSLPRGAYKPLLVVEGVGEDGGVRLGRGLCQETLEKTGLSASEGLTPAG